MASPMRRLRCGLGQGRLLPQTSCRPRRRDVHAVLNSAAVMRTPRTAVLGEGAGPGAFVELTSSAPATLAPAPATAAPEVPALHPA